MKTQNNKQNPITRLTSNENFVELQEQLLLFLSKRKNLDQRDYILSLGFDDVLDNDELSGMDVFQAFVAVMLMIHQIALVNQVYEICSLVRPVVEKEERLIRKNIKMIDDQEYKDELELELYFSMEYFEATVQQILNANTND